MTVETLKHTFLQKDLSEYNDDVYRERIFDARGREFAFELLPGTATLFWRFGLAFSRSEDFAFEPNKGRYSNTDLYYFEINVGGMANRQWANPNDIALSSYYIKEPPPPYDAVSNYTPGAPVTLTLRYLEEVGNAPNTLWFKYDTPNHKGVPVNILVGDYRFFRAFAWADYKEFSLNCTITVIDKTVQSSGTFGAQPTAVGSKIVFSESERQTKSSPSAHPNSNPVSSIGVNLGDAESQSTDPSSSSAGSATPDPRPPQSSADPVNAAPTTTHWLLKIREQTWGIRDFFVGQDVWFTTYTLISGKRQEYALYLTLHAGDQLLAYAYETYHAVVGILEITEGVHTDQGRGEVISMKIKELFDPYIPLEAFYPGIPAGEQLTADDPRRLVSISQAEYAQILAQKKTRYPDQFWLPAYTSEGNRFSTQDQLEFSYDIRSFATVITLKSVKPPLAIGLFGNWGSGKSFFMENLSAEIDKLKGTRTRYVEKVVQVTFNSWHYSDANLWASLITEIFDKLYEFSKTEGKQDELEKLSQTLQLTTVHKEETEAKKKALEFKQADLEKQQQNDRDRLKDISGLQLVGLLLKDPRVQADLKELDSRNIESIFENKAKIEGYLTELENDKNRLSYFFRKLFRLRGRWIWIVLLAAVFLLISLFVTHITFLGAFWDEIWTRIAGVVFGASALATTVWKAYQPVRKNFKEAYDRLTSVKRTIESRPVTESPELIQVRKDLQAVKTSLETIDEQLKQTTRELDEIRTGKKLLNFIEQRSRNEQYARQLGLISWIRKDFNTLDDLLRKQYLLSKEEQKKINPKDVQLKIDRIVLYIDDLDRCSEEVVIRVLEAVNLLLAFELFVVVVGVDPRWLKESLEKRYSFFTDQGVSSFDYLEKIFQIPFTLKPITKKGREDLISYLLNDKEPVDSGPDKPPPAQTPTIPESGQSSVPETTTLPSTPVTPNSTIRSRVTVPPVPPPSPTTTTTPMPPTPEEENLVFSNDELIVMKEVSPLFGHTPRTIKRFVNIYRIVKSHRQFERSENPRPTLLLLAIVVGCPEHAGAFVSQLRNQTDLPLGTFLDRKELKKLKAWMIRHTDKKSWSAISINAIKRNLDLVSRFSFRTGT